MPSEPARRAPRAVHVHRRDDHRRRVRRIAASLKVSGAATSDLDDQLNYSRPVSSLPPHRLLLNPRRAGRTSSQARLLDRSAWIPDLTRPREVRTPFRSEWRGRASSSRDLVVPSSTRRLAHPVRFDLRMSCLTRSRHLVVRQTQCNDRAHDFHQRRARRRARDGPRCLEATCTATIPTRSDSPAVAVRCWCALTGGPRSPRSCGRPRTGSQALSSEGSDRDHRTPLPRCCCQRSSPTYRTRRSLAAATRRASELRQRPHTGEARGDR